ncbi:MAG: hypothetical protein PHF31_10270 [Methylobacter sp.]|nr:hypothetical protein [Methylobacter sp.]
MNQQDQPNIDKHLVVSGNQCRLTDNSTHKNKFQFDTGLVSEAFEKCYPFLRFGRIA